MLRNKLCSSKKRWDLTKACFLLRAILTRLGGSIDINVTYQIMYFRTSKKRWDQWRNVTIWCPPAHFLPPPQIFYCLQKTKKKKKKKKVATFFSVFLIGFLPPWSFLYPKYFFRVDRTLSWPRYGTFCCFVKPFFV